MTDEAEGLNFGDPEPVPQRRDTNKPTHFLSVREKNGRGSTRIGAGWMNEQGTVTIRLNPCVVLTSKDDVHIKLFPIEEEPF